MTSVDVLIERLTDHWSDDAAICHAPWLLIETGIVKDRKVTSLGSIKTVVINAGGKGEDSQVVADMGLVTSPNPDDLAAFSTKII